MGVYIFGSMVALTELVCEDPKVINSIQKPSYVPAPPPRPVSVVIDETKPVDGNTSGL